MFFHILYVFFADKFNRANGCFGRIGLFNAVNLEQGYGLIEIRTPNEVLYEEDI